MGARLGFDIDAVKPSFDSPDFSEPGGKIEERPVIRAERGIGAGAVSGVERHGIVDGELCDGDADQQDRKRSTDDVECHVQAFHAASIHRAKRTRAL